MWIYYYAMFGPGHQSSDYGFKYFSDDYAMDDIQDNLHNMLSNYNGVVLEFWKVKHPSADYLEEKKKDTEDSIKSLKKYLEMLKKTTSFVSTEEDKADPVLQKSLRRLITSNFLRRLHNAGFMFDAKDVNDWYHGKKSIAEPMRTKVLDIAKQSKKYPKY